MVVRNDEKKSTSYAWIILAVLFIGHIAAFGIRSSFGVYISPWEQEFAASRSLVSSISMLSFVVFAVFQPLAGKLNDHFGKGFVPIISVFLMGASLTLMSQANHIWQIFILFGVVFSIGFAGCSSSIPVVILSNWFVKKRGLALGIVMAGMAVGQLILVPVSLYLVNQTGWRTTVTILGIIVIVVVGVLFLIFIRSAPAEKGLKPYGYSESCDEGSVALDLTSEEKKILPIVSVLKMKIFWQLSIPYFICGFSDTGIVQTHLIPIAEGKGLPVSIVAIAFILIAIANIAGTIITGYLSDRISRTRQLAVIYMTRAATYAFLIVLNQSWLILIFALIYGVVEMASIAPTNSLTVQAFDGFSIGVIVGLVMVSHSIGGAIGSWVPGIVFDLTGSYNIVLVVSIALLVAAALVTLKIPENRENEK